MLISTLFGLTATTVDPYPGGIRQATCKFHNTQPCVDAIKYRALGGLKVPDAALAEPPDLPAGRSGRSKINRAVAGAPTPSPGQFTLLPSSGE